MAVRSPSLLLVTGGYDHNIRFFDASSASTYRSLAFSEKQVNSLAISNDKTWLAAGGNPQILLYDIPSLNPDPVTTCTGHTSNVTSVGFHKDAKWMYSGSEDGTVKIWDLRAPGCQRDYECRGGVNTVALHPNQAELISGDQKGILRFWDLAGDACSKDFVPESDVPISSVAIASDASLLVAANNKGRCYFWKTSRSSEEYQPFRMIEAHPDAYILRCRISPNTRHLATASSDKTVKLWSLPDMKHTGTLVGHQRWVWDCAFSIDSSYIITASSDCTAKLWEVSSGEAMHTYTGHHKAIVAVALNDSKTPPAPRASAAKPVATPTPTPTAARPKAVVPQPSRASTSTSTGSSSRHATPAAAPPAAIPTTTAQPTKTVPTTTVPTTTTTTAPGAPPPPPPPPSTSGGASGRATTN